MWEKRTFPGVIWILPLLLGFPGGIIAALIASMKYGASWWQLLLVGLIMNILSAFAWIFLFSVML